MGRFMVPKQGGSVLYVCTKFEADSLFVQKLLGGPKMSKMGHLIRRRPRPVMRRFIFHTQAGSVVHLGTTFEADCSIRSKVI